MTGHPDALDGDMADMFYFNSPPRWLSPNYRDNPKSKLSSSKRRRTRRMDAPSQHTCVARLEEPTFCPSNIASLITVQESPFISLLPFTSRQDGATTELPANGIGCEDDAELSPAAELDIVPAPQTLSSGQSSTLSESYSTTRSRPPGDTWEQEAAPRLHSALGDADVDEALSHEPSQTLASDSAPDRPAGTTLDCAVLDYYAIRDYFVYDITIERRLVRLQNPLAETRLHGSMVDYDALAVDDARTSYSFGGFIDTWYSEKERFVDWRPSSSLIPECLRVEMRKPCSRPRLRSLLGSSRPDEVRRDKTRNFGVDMQGLQWDLSDLGREQALEARRWFHPSRRNAVEQGRMSEHPYSLADVHYCFRAYVRTQRPHISHYQLRNVIAASSRNDIYYSIGDSILQTSLASSSMTNTVMNLSKPSNSSTGFRITTLSTSPNDSAFGYRSDNVLFAGGFYGEFAVLNLESERPSPPVEGFVTNDYNGLVTHVHSYSDRKSGVLRAVFCSNDRKVRIMDASTARFVDTFEYDSAINCSATSPDGRLRVLVGDSYETLVTDAGKGEILVTLKEHSDYGFACAWSNDNSRYIATGAQDNKVVVWDARNWSMPLETLQCVMSSARSLHFTADNALIVGEEDDVVSIYDTKRFELRQDIRFFGSIAGIAVLEGGAEIVVANADKAVGGLLCFQRTPQGLNHGTYGEHVHTGLANDDKTYRRWPRCSAMESMRTNYASDVFV